MAKWAKEEIAKAQDALKGILSAGDNVYLVLKSKASSGLSRRMACLIIDVDVEGKQYIRNISRLVARATDNRYHKGEDAVGISGCGMDMGFALIYDLSST